MTGGSDGWSYRANELCAVLIHSLFVIMLPRSGGERSMESCLNVRSFSPSARPSAFMIMLSKAIVAHALLVV